MTFFRFLLTAIFALAMNIAAAQEFVAVPPLTAHVIDKAGMLDGGQRDALDHALSEYEARTGSQIAVLLIPSTAPEAIEQYSIRVADAWKLGRKGVDDGVILLVAKDNPKSLRRLRIETGRGVQGSLTDAQSKRVLEDVIAPHFRQNDFYGGLVAGVSAIETLLAGEQLPAAQSHDGQQSSHGISIFQLLFIIFVMMILSRAGRSRRRLNGNGWGTAAGIIIGDSIARNQRGDYGGSGGGFGGSSGGGFSGGGGGFDGGGASGDW